MGSCLTRTGLGCSGHADYGTHADSWGWMFCGFSASLGLLLCMAPNVRVRMRKIRSPINDRAVIVAKKLAAHSLAGMPNFLVCTGCPIYSPFLYLLGEPVAAVMWIFFAPIRLTLPSGNKAKPINRNLWWATPSLYQRSRKFFTLELPFYALHLSGKP